MEEKREDVKKFNYIKDTSRFSIAVNKYWEINKDNETGLGTTFTETFLSINTLGRLYGTYEDGTPETYRKTLLDAWESRIKAPISQWFANPKVCFFAPYENRKQHANAALGMCFALTNLLTFLGIIAVSASSPILLVAFLALPALTELVLGIGSLLQGIYYQAKAEAVKNNKLEENPLAQEANNMAGAYFRDGVTRVALSIPLAVVCAIASIPEFVRFCTRTLTTVLKNANEAKELQFIAYDEEIHSGGYRPS